MKPGYKTTEFWLASLSSAMVWFTQMGVLPTDAPQEPVKALAANAVIIVAYIIARMKAKQAAGGSQ